MNITIRSESSLGVTAIKTVTVAALLWDTHTSHMELLVFLPRTSQVPHSILLT